MAPVKVRSSTRPAEAGEADGEEGGVGLGEALPVGEPEQAGSATQIDATIARLRRTRQGI